MSELIDLAQIVIQNKSRSIDVDKALLSGIIRLEKDKANLKSALLEAMEWNWLDDDAPPRFDVNNLPDHLKGDKQ